MYLCDLAIRSCRVRLVYHWVELFLPNLLLLTCPISKASNKSKIHISTDKHNAQRQHYREEDEGQIHSWRNVIELD